MTLTKEHYRIRQRTQGDKEWSKWGPYMAERQWGTIREDYSPDGTAWEHISHNAARSKAYRWGEEGIAGICDEEQTLCFAISLWNGKDSILKERLFGLTGHEGNHGEDVKELYFYLDGTPTHSYLKMLYKYPQRAFPYQELVRENRRRGKADPEYELIDTGIFDENRYFDILVEYAKASPFDILARITVVNRGSDEARLWVVPQLWFRNTWAWNPLSTKPRLALKNHAINAQSDTIGTYVLHVENADEILFTENETNRTRLYGEPANGAYFKDAINDYVVKGQHNAVNPEHTGTKSAILHKLVIPPGKSSVIRQRLCGAGYGEPFATFDRLVEERRKEADEFYAQIQESMDDPDARSVQRQAFAGMMWSKQFYYYDVGQWLEGDPGAIAPPQERLKGRNHEWEHLNNFDILSMPDTWEYPWYAAWDLAFHCIPIAMIDPDFAKSQLVLLTRERYMHPNGQLPAYEWAFGDVNPPVHAWSTWRVYKMDKKQHGMGDYAFLERVFQKLLLNFTWWVNRKDHDGNNLFQGGFLGLDNIGVFDRSAPLPTGGHLEQADGTSWMAMYCLNMLKIALELAQKNHVYEDMATKFFEHFLYIAKAMMHMCDGCVNLWDEEDEFYYDVLHAGNEESHLMKVRSMVGLIPLFAVETLDPEQLANVPGFKRRMEWFLTYRPDLADLVSHWFEPGLGKRRLLSLLRGHRMKMLLRRMLDPNEFLSDYGIRSLSKYHEEHPYVFEADGQRYTVDYVPAESNTNLFGGNSNWRGPIWFPVNFLIIESLQKFHHYYGDDFKIECPTGSGTFMTISDVADELSRRLSRIFLLDGNGQRPVFNGRQKRNHDPHFTQYILFYEYFHGENGSGAGASHQTGWTGLVAKLLQPRDHERGGAC